MSSLGGFGFVSQALNLSTMSAHIGAVKNPSKSQTPVSRLQAPPPQESSLLSKRTEYLEEQEKRLSSKIVDVDTTYRNQVVELSSKVDGLESTNVIAHTTKSLDRVASIDEFRTDANRRDIEYFPPAAYVLYYPMEKIEFSNGYVCLLRCKTVNPTTGQVSMDWAVVFEEWDGKRTYCIDRFSAK